MPGGVVGPLLLGERILEDLQRRGDLAHLGVRGVRGNHRIQIALGQRVDRREHRCNPARDIAHEGGACRETADHGNGEDDRHHPAGRCIGVAGVAGRGFGAAVVQFGHLGHGGVHGPAGRHHLAGIGRLCGFKVALARKHLHVFGGLDEDLPQAFDLGGKLPLLG